MRPNSALENIFGTIGTVLWTGQLIPQVWKSWREKTTVGLSPWLMLIWAVSGAFLGVYAIVQNINIPIIVQPQIFSLLAALSWIQCVYYSSSRFRDRTAACLALYLLFAVLFASFETGMVHAARIAVLNGASGFLDFFGVASGVLICVALIPQFVEIYRLKEVRGISLLFLSVDISGGVFSMLSLGFKAKMDWIAAVTYLGVIILDSTIIVLAFILNPIAKKRRRQAAIADDDNRSSHSHTAIIVSQLGSEPSHTEKEKGVGSAV